MDCDDNENNINPNISEVCDAIDNNCDGRADEGLPTNRYYFDFDNDGFGDLNVFADTCISVPPAGFVINPDDCNDNTSDINPTITELCDGIDNNCDGRADEGLPITRYYFDFDNDGYGDLNVFADTCITVPPAGFVTNSEDCNDNDSAINPDAVDIADNGIDEDCSGFDLYKQSKVFPNPFSSFVEVRLDFDQEYTARIIDRIGRVAAIKTGLIGDNFFVFEMDGMEPGLYYLQVLDSDNEELYTEKILKI
jgi:hypothetical protein